jgi:hypothetical protein
MHHVQFQMSDQLYLSAQQQAEEGGFSSVDEYVAVVFQNYLNTPDMEHLFTPERMAIIERATAEYEAGLGMTREQANAKFAEMRRAWDNR